MSVHIGPHGPRVAFIMNADGEHLKQLTFRKPDQDHNLRSVAQRHHLLSFMFLMSKKESSDV